MGYTKSVPARADCMVLGVMAEVVHTVCLSADGWGAKAAKLRRSRPCGIVHHVVPNHDGRGSVI